MQRGWESFQVSMLSSVPSLCEPRNYKRHLYREGMARTVCGSGMNPPLTRKVHDSSLPLFQAQPAELVVRLGNVRLTFPIDRLPMALARLVSPERN